MGRDWDIELVFKELKAGTDLESLITKNPQIVELISGLQILTLFISRRIYIVRKHNPKEKMIGCFSEVREIQTTY